MLTLDFINQIYMSTLYYMAIIGTTIGLYLIIMFIVINLRSKLRITKVETILLLIGILLTVWGIDALIHLEQF